jgi:hypothetical protein
MTSCGLQGASWRPRRSLRVAAFVFLVAWACASMGLGFWRALGPWGGHDLHAYWMAGHFVRRGENPYAAHFEQRRPQGPVHYLDGYVPEGHPVHQEGMSTVPSNTAPVVLLLHALAYFSWDTARALWACLNLGSALVAPWLALSLLRDRIDRSGAWLVALAFYGWSAVRNALYLGQTAMPVFVLMVAAVALSSAGRPVLAGLVLGVALSKYSLALPILLVFGIRRRWREIVLAGAVQLTGVMAVAILAGQSPWGVVQTYLTMLSLHVGQRGIDLKALLPNNSRLALPAALLLTLLVVRALRPSLNGVARSAMTGGETPRAAHPHLAPEEHWMLCVSSIWVLLVAYHRVYDAVLLLFPATRLMSLMRADARSFSPSARATPILMAVAAVVGTLILSLPGSLGGAPLAGQPTYVDVAIAGSLVMLLALLLWFDRSDAHLDLELS